MYAKDVVISAIYTECKYELRNTTFFVIPLYMFEGNTKTNNVINLAPRSSAANLVSSI